MLPQFVPFEQPHTLIGHFWQAAILDAPTAGETQEWHAGIAQAIAEGIYFIAQVHHEAIGIKPETVGEASASQHTSLAEQTAAADALQLTLRFSFQARLSGGVRLPAREMLR